jgi:hypothetical protein
MKAADIMRARGIRAGLAAGVLALGAASGCDHREPLLGPGREGVPGDAPVAELPGDSAVTLREGARVRIGLGTNRVQGRSVRVGLLLLDSARAVLWRSPAVVSDSGAATVPVDGLGAQLQGRGPLFLTASAEGPDGRRVYAGRDARAAGTLRDASLLKVHVRAGRVVGVGGLVRALAADPRRGRLYFTRAGSGEVGTLELGSLTAGAPAARDGAEVGDVALAGRFLAYLADAGSRVVFVPLEGGGEVRSALLGPLDVRTTRVYPASGAGEDTVPRKEVVSERVRPYGTALRLFCADREETCEAPVALVPSRTQGNGGVLRTVGYADAAGPLVAPAFLRLAGGPDTVAAALVVRGPRRPDGGPELLSSRPGVAGCAALHLGVEAFAVTPGGRLFAASGAACGPAGRLLRVDGAGGHAPTIGRLASETVAAEDRIGTPRQVAVSHDGTRVLVRDDRGVWLLDGDARALGFRRSAGASRVAWLDGTGRGQPLRFLVADGGRVGVYEADRFGPVAEVVTGPLADAPVAAVARPNGERAAVVVPAEDPAAVVVVPLPAR